MVIAFDRKNKVEDTIMFEKGDRYIVQKRRHLQPIKEQEILFEEENAEEKAEGIFDCWSV